MKTMKKLFAIALVVMMIAALAVPAFAADGGTITVMNAKTDIYKYEAYKIFDVTEDADGTREYSIKNGSAWLSTMIDGDGNSKVPGLEFIRDDSVTPVKYTVKKLSGFSAADFADTLKAAIPDSLTGDEVKKDFGDGNGSVDVGANGYYLVLTRNKSTDEIQKNAALTTVNNGAEVKIQNKNDMPFEKDVQKDEDSSWVKSDDKQIGDTVEYKITSAVPGDIDASTTEYIYLVNDTMDAGLTFNKDVKVKINDVEIALLEVTNPSTSLTGDSIRYKDNGFELSLDMVAHKADAGKEVLITYSGILNENALNVVTDNKATLTYGETPSTTTTKNSEARVYTCKITINKFETGNQSQKLAGAEFRLYKLDGTAKKYYKFDAATATAPAMVTWKDAAADGDTFVTGTDGAVEIPGLPDGTYYLEEIKAPSGYVMLTDPIEVVVNGEASLDTGINDAQVAVELNHIADVENTPGTSLPSTGGIGTTIFYVVGAILVLGAGVLLITRKRVSAEEK